MDKYFLYSKFCFRKAMDKDGFIASGPLILDGQPQAFKEGTSEEWYYQGAPESFGSDKLLAVGSYGFSRKGKLRQFRIALPA